MTKLWIVFVICIVTFLAGLGLGYQLFSGQIKIVGAIDIPKDQLTTTKPLKNAFGLSGSFAPKDGTIVVGGFYNRSLGCFFIGPSIETTINNYDNIRVGIQTGLRW